MKILFDKITFYKKDKIYKAKAPVIYNGFVFDCFQIEKIDDTDNIEVNFSVKRIYGKKKISEMIEYICLFGFNIYPKSLSIIYNHNYRFILRKTLKYTESIDKKIDVCFYFYRI